MAGPRRGRDQGGVFRTGGYGKIPIIRDLARSNSLLYRQSITLRLRWMVERFRAWEDARDQGWPPPDSARQGVLFSLATTIEPSPSWKAPELPPWSSQDVSDWRYKLVTTKTSFGRFKGDLGRDLVYRGWWLTGASLTKFHPSLAPTPPLWRELA